ncbi:MAG: ATP-dependent DNA helicase RecG [Dehalococcoidia bacterium]|nr:ATP-dependent DNA helicase RecG [Dehalococcoidia bacterium]
MGEGWDENDTPGSLLAPLGNLPPRSILWETAMNDADAQGIDALRSILNLEREQGFENKAVMGGLDRFLDQWKSRLTPIIGTPPEYATLSPEQRGQWADHVLSRLPATDRKARPKRPSSARRRPAPSPITLDDDISRIRGVTQSHLPKLRRLDLLTVRDLLHHFPYRHNDFADIRQIAELQFGMEQTILAEVTEISQSTIGSRRSSAHAVLTDSTGGVRATWFNQGYLVNTLRPGTKVFVSGKVSAFRQHLLFENPEYEIMRGQDDLMHTGRLVPIYPLVDGLYQRTLRGIVKRALDATLSQIDDHLPEDVIHRTGMLGLQSAVSQMHYPDSAESKEAARSRLAFDEMFLLQMAILRRKLLWQEENTGVPLNTDLAELTSFVDSLPFSLTEAQNRASDEILSDLRLATPMSRLLEGDVGSGKTVVAALAMLAAALNGYQAALLAPTEILAEQHFLTITRLLRRSAPAEQGQHIVTISVGERTVTVGLLLGSLPKRVKDDMRLMLAAEQVDIVIGTHAVIQESVDIPKLALAVVDEQHRFGVMQRAALREKGTRPHLLVMSATPIPRSLALTLYGELDRSVIDEMPPGRPPIVTRYELPERRHIVYNFVRSQIEEGRQAFIVLPFIEESEVPVARAMFESGAPYRPTPGEDTLRTKFVKGAVNEFERLSKEVFPDLRLGLLHGRMPLSEKETIMDSFQRREIDILVSTPVVEVGIDIPNATVMLIDGADRFGLAQLHQFRGRVGRGKHESFCILLADEPGGNARERLKLVEKFRDGFKLAEMDLDLRGPGDYLGTRQSGVPVFKIAKITDQDIATLARAEGQKILQTDPALGKPEHKLLAERLAVYENTITGEMS